MLIPILKNIHREKHGQILKKISEWVDDSKIKPLLHHQKFSFDDVGKAHLCLEGGHAIGKIALENIW